jgi:hypothetical protein
VYRFGKPVSPCATLVLELSLHRLCFLVQTQVNVECHVAGGQLKVGCVVDLW